jgi:sugar/nucleoside kinase (ribokinase family)
MDVLCIGEALIDFVARERGDSLVTAAQYNAATGGAPANVAAGLAKLDRSARLIATVGEDVFGEKIVHDLEAIGVECALRRDPDHFTTLAFVLQKPGGGREFLFNIGAHEHLLPEQITAGDVTNTRILHYGSVSLSTPQSRETVLHAIQLANTAGAVTSCSPDWRPALWAQPKEGRAVMCEAIAHADILRTSLPDLSFLVPDHADDYAAAIEAIGFNGRLAVITLGRDGAWYQAGGHTGQVPSPPVKVVETTGSGDSFTAALLDSLLDYDLTLDDMTEDDLRQVMVRACAAGAITATGYGAIPSLPDATEINALLRMMNLGANGTSQ